MSGWQDVSGLNRGYVLELYERFRRDPSSVDPASRTLFETWTPPLEREEPAAAAGFSIEKVVGAVNLAQSIRRYGHLAAQLDPLGSRPLGDPSLLPDTHGVTEDDLRALPGSLVSRPPVDGAASALDAVETLRRIYCSRTGFDFAHVFVPEEHTFSALDRRARASGMPVHTDPREVECGVQRITLVAVLGLQKV